MLSLLQVTGRWGPGALMPGGPTVPTSRSKRGDVSQSPWGRPHHHLDVPVVDRDAADVGGRLPVGDAFLVQLTAAQDEAWGNSTPHMTAHQGALGSHPQLSGRSALFGTLATSRQAYVPHTSVLLWVLETWRPRDLESSRHQDFKNFAGWKWDPQLSSGFSQSLSWSL